MARAGWLHAPVDLRCRAGSDASSTRRCVEILEHVTDLNRVLAETAREPKPGGTVLLDTINQCALSRLAAVTTAKDVLWLLPRGTHDPARFIWRPGRVSRCSGPG